MPDAAGNFKGSGWSRAGEAAWERAFGNAASQQRLAEMSMPLELRPVPREPTPEVEWLADRSEAEEDWGELADEQAARDGYNPAW